MLHSLDESIGFMTAQTHRAMIRLLTAHLKTYQITPEQWTVLKRLNKHGDLTQKELSQVAEKDKATLTRILDILGRKKLIERKPNDQDKRSFLVGLTQTGEQLYEKVKPTIEMLFSETIAAGISEEELELFYHVLTRLRENSSRSY